MCVSTCKAKKKQSKADSVKTPKQAMEQDSTEMHLSRIRDVKELAVLSDEARDVVKEEVILESSGHQVRNNIQINK